MFAQLLRKNANRIPANLLRVLGNFWPPFCGAGIKIVYTSPDYREVKVRMKLRWYNKNYVGTHFGGSMYAMTDPFYMMMLINILGARYIVWDKGAKIDFKKPGRGTVHTHFVFSEQEIQDIKLKADELGKYVFDKPVDVVDDAGAVIASVMKTLYVRSRDKQLRKLWFTLAELSTESGILVLKAVLTPKNGVDPEARVTIALRVLSDHQAVVAGIGNGEGGVVSAVDTDNGTELIYSGFRFIRANDR